MTTGPEPRIRTDGRCPAAVTTRPRAGADAGGHEPVENRQRVERPGGPFRVVLDRLDRQLAVAQALDRPVVEVDLADVEAAPAPGSESPTTLTSWFWAVTWTSPRVDVADRMVRAVMAEAQPARVGARGAADDLVAEADPEQRPPVGDRRPGEADRTVEPGRVARARRQDEAVDVAAQRIGDVDGVGQDPDPRAAPAERADDVLLEAEVDDRDERPAFGRVADVARAPPARPGRRSPGPPSAAPPGRPRPPRRGPSHPGAVTTPGASRSSAGDGRGPACRRRRSPGCPASRSSAASWRPSSTTAAVALATTRPRSHGRADWSSSRSRP